MSYLTVRWPSVVTILALLAGVLFAIPRTSAAEVPCSSFLQEYADWAKQTSSKTEYYLGFTLASNQVNSIVGYTEGKLVYQKPSWFTPATLRTPSGSEGTQYFNVRRYGGNTFAEGYPFDPNATDKLGVSINTSTGKITLKLVSWGGALINVTPQCDNGVMFGFGDTSPIKSLFVLSLTKQSTDIPQ